MLKNVDYEILKFVALRGKANMTLLKEELGLTWTTLTNAVDRLVAGGFLAEEREGFPPTRWLNLTEKGFEVLGAEAEIVGEESARIEDWVKDETLEVEVAKRLHTFGAAITIQPIYGMKEAILSAGILPAKTLISSFLYLGSIEREYLEFLSKLYVGSPKKLFGEKPRNFIEVRVCWQLARSDAWRTRDIRGECFQFDYPSTWRELREKISLALKERMEKLGRNEWRTFRLLRAFSFPSSERHSLAKKGLLVTQPENEK
ncbi:MAG: MarR family winged helix-turn-helix transcriptional regulator [Candidatus Bathyarchaeia archaeon]